VPLAKTPIRIVLSDDERDELTRLARSQTAPYRSVVRARTILLLEAGQSVGAVARAVGRDRKRVRLWGQRFVRKRLRGLEDLARSGRPARFSPQRRRRAGQAGV
jgi:hypothetical protein